MPSLSYYDVHKYAKSCGFTLKRTAGRSYHLETVYGDYTCTTLAQVNSHIIKDNARFGKSRF